MPHEMRTTYAYQGSAISPVEKRTSRNTHINTEVFLQSCKRSEGDSGASESQMLSQRQTSISPVRGQTRSPAY